MEGMRLWQQLSGESLEEGAAMLSPSHRGTSTALPGQQHLWVGWSFCATGKCRGATLQQCLRANAARMRVTGCSRVPPSPGYWWGPLFSFASSSPSLLR